MIKKTWKQKLSIIMAGTLMVGITNISTIFAMEGNSGYEIAVSENEISGMESAETVTEGKDATETKGTDEDPEDIVSSFADRSLPTMENADASDMEEGKVMLSEENAFIEDASKNTDASDIVNVAESVRSGADMEDVTASFTDSNFLNAVRKTLGLSDDAPITRGVCENVTYLDVSEKNIRSLAGIENFTNLNTLICGSENDQITNQLTTLDLSNCPNLIELDCSNNQLTELNVTKCANLETLECGNNQLATLDVTKCPNLKFLECGSYYYSLGNQLTELNVTNCTKLTTLRCRSNKLKALDVSQCRELEYLDCGASRQTEDSNKNQLKALDIVNCPNLRVLYCDSNQLTTLDLSNCPNLTELDCSRNQLTELNVTKCANLETLECENNQLSALDVIKCPKLKELRCDSNQLSSLDVSQCPNLESLTCFWNQLSKLDLSRCPKLKGLGCGVNKLTELDVSQCPELRSLSCAGNEFTKLDVSLCADLTTLECHENRLLTNLICCNNKLTRLRVDNCDSLVELNCSGNWLKELRLGICKNLIELDCSNNDLMELDITGCKSLRKLDCSSNYMKSPEDVKGKDASLTGENFIFDPQKGVDVTATFTDPNFLAAVRENLGLGDGAPITIDICQNVNDLNVSGKNISSLAGIENFKNLGYFACSNNQLTELNLTNCPNISQLYCDENQLTKLDVTKCSDLCDLDCSNNQLTELELNDCTKLAALSCEENILAALNVNACTGLERLYCNVNQLTTLDLSNCPNLIKLDCSNNQLTELNVTKCTNLETLKCGNNQLATLDVTKCPNLKFLECGSRYYSLGNQLTELNVTNCTKLTTLSCRSNKLKALDVSQCRELEYLDCGASRQTEDSNKNQLKALYIVNCPNLRELYCDSNQLTTLDLSNCPNLTELDCSNNQLTGLDVSNCTKLTYLECLHNMMKSPDDVKGKNAKLNFHFDPQRNDTKKPQNLTVKPSTLKFYVDGEAQNLEVSNAVGTVTYTSSDRKIVKVDAKGKVTPVSKGTATVTIKALGDNFYKEAILKVNVTVDNKPMEAKSQNPKVEPKSLKLYVGGKAQNLKVSNAVGTVTYTSSDRKIAKVDTKGRVTPVSKGTAIITVKASGNSSYKEVSLKINVTVQRKSQNPKVKPSTLNLYTGGEAQTLEVLSAKGKVTYISSKPNIVKVNSKGKVTPISKGTAAITIKAAGNKSYKAAAVQVKVTVYGRPAAVKKVKATRTNKNRSLKVTWKKTPSAFGYIIKYSYHKNMKNSRTAQIFKDGVASKTLKNIKPKKAVYVQVQAYAKKGGLTIPGDWSKIIKSEPAKEKAVSGNKTAK